MILLNQLFSKVQTDQKFARKTALNMYDTEIIEVFKLKKKMIWTLCLDVLWF